MERGAQVEAQSERGACCILAASSCSLAASVCSRVSSASFCAYTCRGADATRGFSHVRFVNRFHQMHAHQTKQAAMKLMSLIIVRVNRNEPTARTVSDHLMTVRGAAARFDQHNQSNDPSGRMRRRKAPARAGELLVFV